jgi:hypothetical protein
MITTHAVAKLIIAGEHAVVYRRPLLPYQYPRSEPMYRLWRLPMGRAVSSIALI